MKVKNLLLFWVLMAIGIIIASTNHFQLRPGTPITVPDSVAGEALFVCPATDVEFDIMAVQFGMVKGIVSTVFLFIIIFWAAIFGWVLYQSLLKDKFEKKSYDLPIFLGKSLLFLFVLGMIILRTPNYFRNVIVAGNEDKWVLCESDTPGARAVKKTALVPRGK